MTIAIFFLVKFPKTLSSFILILNKQYHTTKAKTTAKGILGQEIIFDISFSYIASLLFLSFIGSVLAFTLYLKLIEQIGAGRAGYIGAILPVIALIISTYFENLVWNQSIILGLFFLILGAVLVVHQKKQK